MIILLKLLLVVVVMLLGLKLLLLLLLLVILRAAVQVLMLLLPVLLHVPDRVTVEAAQLLAELEAVLEDAAAAEAVVVQAGVLFDGQPALLPSASGGGGDLLLHRDHADVVGLWVGERRDGDSPVLFGVVLGGGRDGFGRGRGRGGGRPVVRGGGGRLALGRGGGCEGGK